MANFEAAQTYTPAMSGPDPEISVCICAFRRPDDLRNLLESLLKQVSSTPAYELVVIDNDSAMTSAPIIEEFTNSGLRIHYAVEPVQNISRARNRSISASAGKLIAIIDDDEIAEENWLAELYKGMIGYHADAVFGPVYPRFREMPPAWIVDGGFFDYAPLETGQPVPLETARTSNVMIKRSSLPDANKIFDEKLGLSGGEDTDLFRRMGEQGARMIAVRTAVVHENIAAHRTTMKWLSRRWFHYGNLRIDIHHNKRNSFKYLAATASVAMYGVLTSIARAARRLPFSKTKAAAHYLRACYWAGVLANLAGYMYKEYE
jgi:succinoglycan biosynthesis protein ExoM